MIVQETSLKIKKTLPNKAGIEEPDINFEMHEQCDGRIPLAAVNTSQQTVNTGEAARLTKKVDALDGASSTYNWPGAGR